MNRQALVSVGLLAMGVAFATGGCEDDPSTPAAEAGQAGRGDPPTNAGESSGGSGSVVPPQAGEGGMPQVASGGGGGQPEGGTGAVVQGGAGGTPEQGGAGGVPAEGGAGGNASNSCPVPSTFGQLNTLPGALLGSANAYRGELELEPPAEGYLQIELVEPFPPFEDGVTTLTNHVLSGPDLNYGTCGLCLRLVTYPNGIGGGTIQHYYVTGGTISLSEVEDGMTATATNLTFEEVTLNTDTFFTTPVPNGCETAITSVAVDESLASGGAGGSGG